MKRNPLFIEVANQLTQLIQEKYPPGSKIPIEPELMQMFGVSRTTIRSAISSLCSKNILEIRRGAGTFVTQSPGLASDALGIQFLDPEIVSNDIGEMSRLVQPAAAAMGAARITDADKEQLKAALSDLEEGWKLYQYNMISYAELRKRDSRFHSAVINSSHNYIMERLDTVFIEFTKKTREQDNIDIITDSLELHPKILDAIISGNAEKASRLMAEHMDNVRNILDPNFSDNS